MFCCTYLCRTSEQNFSVCENIFVLVSKTNVLRINKITDSILETNLYLSSVARSNNFPVFSSPYLSIPKR